MLTAGLSKFKYHTNGTDFQVMKESWRAAESWYCERPGETIGEDAALVIVGTKD